MKVKYLLAMDCDEQGYRDTSGYCHRCKNAFHRREEFDLDDEEGLTKAIACFIEEYPQGDYEIYVIQSHREWNQDEFEGGGTMDLVWGPDLDFKESNSQVYKFLGSEKYQPLLTSIYAGLGIPPTLTGSEQDDEHEKKMSRIGQEAKSLAQKIKEEKRLKEKEEENKRIIAESKRIKEQDLKKLEELRAKYEQDN